MKNWLDVSGNIFYLLHIFPGKKAVLFLDLLNSKIKMNSPLTRLIHCPLKVASRKLSSKINNGDSDVGMEIVCDKASRMSLYIDVKYKFSGSLAKL